LVLKIEIPGRTITSQTDEYTQITVGAGENWDELVAWSVEQNLHGIEALSLIPGTVGAAPVQNIGAYGQELSETLTHLEAYDIKAGAMITLSNADCKFSYRDSLFKHAGRGRYVITSLSLRLTPATGSQPANYSRLQNRLEAEGITHPTVADIRKTVIAIRQARLPDPAQIPTVGSFFSNPLVDPEAATALHNAYPEMPQWQMPHKKVKLAAAWLVEKCGFKGVVEGGVGMYDKQAIALINPGHKGSDEVLAFRDRVIDAVEQKFGVTLSQEPELISFDSNG
ncbi:MAG TPA: UDP-N-acetylmuramate dehydrogenase, partial [Candidatus Polarisedimenticolaceae bacterium]|nr:UDP-N-acetylmuramate dehydrogenase [Candidatus Polarisedimenticolaceae bacterium]